MEVTGLKECLTRLEKLDAAVTKKILRKALRAGAKLPLAAARANAPVKSGLLKKSLKVRAGARRRGEIHVVAGAGKKWFTGPAFYAAFVAFGHKQGSRRLGGNRRDVPANDFMERAYESTKNSSVEAIRDKTLAEIETTVKALNTK